MGAIFYRQFAEGSKPLLTLAGEEFFRPISIGNNWTSVRMVVQMAVTPNGLNNISAVTHRMGFFAGTGGSLASGFINSALYVALEGNQLNYTNTGPSIIRYVTNTNPTGVKAVNNVTGNTTTVSSVPYGLTGLRTLMAVQVTKGSPNYTISWGYTQVTYMNIDHTIGHVMEAVDMSNVSATWSVAGVTSGLTWSALPIAFNESAGLLDTADIYWSKSQFPLEIYGIYIARVA